MNTPFALFLTWFFPGLGHLVTKVHRRAALYASLILLCLILGMLLNGRLYLPAKGDIISYLASMAQAGMGIIYFILALFTHYRGDAAAATSDYGTLFIITAGLMNLLLLIEVYDITKGKRHAE